ncbi:MAG: hypothetical protein JOZ19_03505 [Rubrobacter sp.]|nr:hypothetical protein [Rubrobacter sp.]
MDFDDFVGPEVAIASAVTAAILSPRVRGVLRRGAVYGVAGALIAGDALSTAARGVGRGTQQAASTTGGVVRGAADSAGGVARSAAERARGAAGSVRSAGSES